MEGQIMPLAERKPPNRTHIDVNDGNELRSFAKHLGVTPKELLAIVEKVGNSAAAVRKEIGMTRSASVTAK
jgi:hypothetical protein